jgi:ATP/maltotriose-dependent transcriptional regulator MalT
MARQRSAYTAARKHDHMLLSTKLFIPPPTPTLVSRPRLVALLNTGASDAALTLLRSPQPPPIQSVLTSTLNAFTTLSKDAVLVLDDYHVIETQQIHQALTYRCHWHVCVCGVS